MQITVFFISFCVSLIVFLITKNSESPRTREQTSLTGHTGRKFVRCFPTIRLLLLLLQLICIQIRAYEKWSSFGDSACDIMLLCGEHQMNLAALPLLLYLSLSLALNLFIHRLDGSQTVITNRYFMQSYFYNRRNDHIFFFFFCDCSFSVVSYQNYKNDRAKKERSKKKMLCKCRLDDEAAGGRQTLFNSSIIYCVWVVHFSCPKLCWRFVSLSVWVVDARTPARCNRIIYRPYSIYRRGCPFSITISSQWIHLSCVCANAK